MGSEEREPGERVRVKREASYPPSHLPLLPSLPLSIHSIFSHMRSSFSLLSFTRRSTPSLCSLLQPLPLVSPSLPQLISDIEIPPAAAFLPRIDELIRKETEDLLSFLIEEIRDSVYDFRLCSGLVCDANLLLETVIEGLKERGRLRRGLEEFFAGAVVVFFEELVRGEEVRRALEEGRKEETEVGRKLRKVMEEMKITQDNVQVSYSTSDLLQQMSIEQVLLYINSVPDCDPKLKKKRRRCKKKGSSSVFSPDIRSLTDEEFDELAASFQSRLESAKSNGKRHRPRASEEWVEKLGEICLRKA